MTRHAYLELEFFFYRSVYTEKDSEHLELDLEDINQN